MSAAAVAAADHHSRSNLATLADVSALVEKHRSRIPHQAHLAAVCQHAAPRRSGQEDAGEIATALQIVLKIEGVEYRTS